MLHSQTTDSSPACTEGSIKEDVDMANLIKRLGRSSGIEQVLNDRGEIDPQDSILADDSDAFRQSADCDIDITLSLKLSDSTNFTEIPLDSEKEQITASVGGEVPINTSPHKVRGTTCFEVISTETVKEGRHSFVLYKILIARNGHEDKRRCIVSKRYSEFETLNSRLRKRFPEIMEDIAFPKKQLIGNFTDETIANRSRSFEQFLTHVHSIDALRFSTEFVEFFYLIDLKEAYQKIRERSYLDAITLLQQCLPIQEKLQGDYSPGVGATLCALVACYEALQKDELALRYGNAALDCFQAMEGDHHYLPLLQSCINVSWKIGRNKQDLEWKMAQQQQRLQQKGHNVQHIPSLMSVVQQKFKNS